MMIEEQPLVKANVDVDDLGDNWPLALVMLIELHEKRYETVVHRRQARRLMERYAAEYFAAKTLDIPARRVAQKMLRARYWDRMRVLRDLITRKYVASLGLQPFKFNSERG